MISTISRVILVVFPLISGPTMFMGLSRSWPNRELCLGYLVFLVLFLAWQVLQKLVLQIGLKRNVPVKFSKGILSKLLPGAKYLIAFLLFVFVLGSLHYVRQRFNEIYLYSLLSLLALASLKQFFMQKSKFLASFGLSLLYYGSVIFCSYYFLSARLDWQAMVFALACAAMLCSLELVSSFWKFCMSTQAAGLQSRLYSLLICLGPALIVGLAIYNQLPQRFFVMAALIPLSSQMLSKVKLVQGPHLPELDIQREATGICALFFVMLLLLMFL